MRAPRRAGIDGRDHTDDDGQQQEDAELAERRVEAEPEVVERARHEQREQNPDRRPEQPADHRGDDALVADHLPHLSLGCADGTQQPELARALVDRKEERVRDPEQGDHDAHREQRVEQVDELVELAADRLGIVGLRLDGRGRNVRESGGQVLLRRVSVDAVARGGEDHPRVAGRGHSGEQVLRDDRPLQQLRVAVDPDRT